MKSWLVEIRKNSKLSTYQVAEKAGISQSYYSLIENENRGVSVKAAKKIAATLGFEWQRFFSDTQKGE